MSEKLIAALGAIADRAGAAHVRVGFLEGATYEGEDASQPGLPVAQVAFWNEFGKDGGDDTPSQPPRPFFRRMIAEVTPQVSKKMEGALEWANYDAAKTLTVLGDWLHDELVDSINKLVDPPLSPVTIAIKKFSKPLIHHKIMINSVGYEVVQGSATDKG